MTVLGPKTADFIRQPKQLLINGRRDHALSGRTFPVTHPATAESIAAAVFLGIHVLKKPRSFCNGYRINQ